MTSVKENISNVYCHIYAGVRCQTLEPIANGAVSNGGVGYWGSSVEYSCDNGFMLSGRAIRTCESNGVWTSEAPLCIGKLTFFELLANEACLQYKTVCIDHLRTLQDITNICFSL